MHSAPDQTLLGLKPLAARRDRGQAEVAELCVQLHVLQQGAKLIRDIRPMPVNKHAVRLERQLSTPNRTACV